MATEIARELGVASTMSALGQAVETAATLPAPAEALARTELAASALASSGDSSRIALPSPRYLPRGQLGEGGMGVVERVYDADLMRDLAVKRLRPELRSEEHLQRQFLWEARVGAYLDHPNIVPVHDLGLTPEDEIFFTMKLLRGGSLEEWLERLRKGDDEAVLRFSLSRRLRIFLQIVNAVAFAHGRGVLHRDLKPANVMVCDHGEVYVTDWGIAVPRRELDIEHLERAAPLGVEGGPSGTPRYMSPEQADGKVVDVRSDVYTLGAILYELVALVQPVDGDTLEEVLDHVRMGKHRRLTDVAPGASPSVVAVVDRAMQLDPGARYATAADLGEDVERILDGQTPTAENASALTRLRRFYGGTDRGLARIRIQDLDFMVASGWFMGIAIGVMLASWLRGVGAWAALAALAASVAMGIPPMVRWLRARKAGVD